MAAELEQIMFPDGKAFEKWLHQNHSTSPGLWMHFAKKKAALTSVYYPEAVEIALCYGWIDGQAKPIDEESYLQRFVPRRPKSIWSKINRTKVEKLIAEGRMQPAGQAQIDKAKADGRWDEAYDSPSTMTVPDDLTAELKKSKQAAEFFAGLNSTNRYAILWRLQTAKKPETRKNRLDKILAMLEKGETFH